MLPQPPDHLIAHVTIAPPAIFQYLGQRAVSWCQRILSPILANPGTRIIDANIISIKTEQLVVFWGLDIESEHNRRGAEKKYDMAWFSSMGLQPLFHETLGAVLS